METAAFKHPSPNGHIPDPAAAAAAKPATATAREPVVPPYWHQRHQRCSSVLSYRSLDSFRPPPITLEDHSDDLFSDTSKALWAKHASVGDYVIVSGSTALGSYVMWNCVVETLDGGVMKLMKRYSEFDDLRQKLVQTFPTSEAAMPPLPPKSVISKFRTKFLEKRKTGLSHFLNCVLLNPEFSGSPVLKEFVFS